MENTTRKSSPEPNGVSMGIAENIFMTHSLYACCFSKSKDGIAKFWQQLTPDKCKAYIMHIHRVISVVLAK